MARIQIEILECPRGHGFRAIAIGDRRVTSSKCCGSWRTVRSWIVDTDELTKAIDGEIRAEDDKAFEAMRERARKNRQKILEAK